jgi:hypothetical protein
MKEIVENVVQCQPLKVCFLAAMGTILVFLAKRLITIPAKDAHESKVTTCFPQLNNQ